MLTESPVDMGVRPVVAGGDGFDGRDLEDDLGFLLGDHARQDAIELERELKIIRSGSAPPTVQGSLAAVKSGLLAEYERDKDGLLLEEELRADPAYLDYYYSHVNLNPRLPPPMLSREAWRITQMLQKGTTAAFGGIGDRRKVGGRVEDADGSNSLFAQQLKLGSLRGEDGGDAGRVVATTGEWVDRGEGDGLIGLPGLAIRRQKSFAEIVQDDVGHSASVASHISRPASRNAFNGVETLNSDGNHFSHNRHEVSAIKSIQPLENGNIDITQSARQAPRTFASVLSGSLSMSSSTDPQLLKRNPSPSLPPVGAKIVAKDKMSSNGLTTFNALSSCSSQALDMVGPFSDLSLTQKSLLSQDSQEHESTHSEIKSPNPFDIHGAQGLIQNPASGTKKEMIRNVLPTVSCRPDLSYHDFGKVYEVNQNSFSLNSEAQNYLHTSVESPSNSLMKFSHATSMNSPGNSPTQFQNSPTQYHKNDSFNCPSPCYGQTGMYANSSLPHLLANQVGTGCLPPLFENAARLSAMGYPGLESFELGPMASGLRVEDLQNLNLNASAAVANGLPLSFVDPLSMQFLRATDYASQMNYNDPLVDGHYSGAYMDALGLMKAHIDTLPPMEKQYGLSSSIRHGDKNARFSVGTRNLGRGVMGPWHQDVMGNSHEGFSFTLLDEFKSNKTRSFELSEISGHVVEFSADQYGSRFIQQKLETATVEEKNMVFQEILPKAFSLMTDVFGNYVIQKFFEHGSATQIRELANQLIGHVLALSLQMYGCRVIQKAIEVVQLDQQIKMVAELDGSVMSCVRDQNGNHVIQKCIECIPQSAIQFIISSFYGHVVTLSTHPYGCRVIQRVLEHCNDPETQQIVMHEIFQRVCMLAQDQYGNYVVQHILEHGKPEERSSIIEKLRGQIVQMSQQKFASNVVEKCLAFGTSQERRLLVSEMLGTTDENEPLQAMMKDQFANYVVQKALETCDDQQREQMLTRIKIHLNALKKYTYGKHIVARVEKLVAAGERRLGVQSSPSLTV